VQESVLAQVRAQPQAFQIAILRSCLERLPRYRQQYRPDEYRYPGYAAASVLYGIACALYRRRLPYTEADVCDLLRFSKHGCGHGGDVTPPFDLALAYARRHDVTPTLLAALNVFADGLTGLTSIQARTLQRKARLLLLLDPNPPPGQKPCWSDRFRAGLAALPPEEQRAWRRLVAQINVNDLNAPPRHWPASVEQQVAELGAVTVLARLEEWWPAAKPGAVVPIQTAGSHLLKYFVWLLAALPDPAAGDDLVRRLSALDWKPRERADKVMLAAAHYLAARPPDVAWPALQRLAAWSAAAPRPAAGAGGAAEAIPEVAAAYAERYGTGR
jgi:hypothetical protein